MPALVFGLLVFVLALWILGVISRVDPKIAARVFKAAGGILAIGFAAFLGLRGEMAVALPLGLLGLGLLGWVPSAIPGFSKRAQKSTGQSSRVRSAFLEMELDHDSGTMRGRIINGSRTGIALEQLDVATLAGLLGEFDDESRALLVAYLDRRQPGWSEDAQGHAAAGRAHVGGGKMTEEEAYQILGIQPGAGAKTITRAHRALMKKLHPDQGGSNYLATRVNEAKDTLLRRHR